MYVSLFLRATLISKVGFIYYGKFYIYYKLLKK